MVERASTKSCECECNVAEAVEPIEYLIRRRAYEIYLERGNRSGSALEDWTRAEREACGR
jgi:hypothetical protein